MRHASGDRLPILGRLGGHQIEALADLLHGAAQHAEIAKRFADRVHLQADLKPLTHYFPRESFAVAVGRHGLDD